MVEGVCSIDGCSKPLQSQGMCAMHRARMRRHGDPHVVYAVHESPRAKPEWGLRERIRHKSVEDPESGCWRWTGSLTRGYGRLHYQGTSRPVHRWAYEAWNGPIPDGFDVDHTCHNDAYCSGGETCPHRRCVNPDHLEAVPPQVNQQRALDGKSTCANGHDYRKWSYVERSTGRRRCRLCARETKRRWKQRQKAARPE